MADYKTVSECFGVSDERMVEISGDIVLLMGDKTNYDGINNFASYIKDHPMPTNELAVMALIIGAIATGGRR